jgi:hypothetical protein
MDDIVDCSGCAVVYGAGVDVKCEIVSYDIPKGDDATASLCCSAVFVAGLFNLR